jgi:hypothetical protein
MKMRDVEAWVLFIRDCLGWDLAAGYNFVPYLIDAPMVEAYVLKEGLMLAQHIID